MAIWWSALPCMCVPFLPSCRRKSRHNPTRTEICLSHASAWTHEIYIQCHFKFNRISGRSFVNKLLSCRREYYVMCRHVRANTPHEHTRTHTHQQTCCGYCTNDLDCVCRWSCCRVWAMCSMSALASHRQRMGGSEYLKLHFVEGANENLCNYLSSVRIRSFYCALNSTKLVDYTLIKWMEDLNLCFVIVAESCSTFDQYICNIRSPVHYDVTPSSAYHEHGRYITQFEPGLIANIITLFTKSIVCTFFKIYSVTRGLNAPMPKQFMGRIWVGFTMTKQTNVIHHRG